MMLASWLETRTRTILDDLAGIVMFSVSLQNVAVVTIADGTFLAVVLNSQLGSALFITMVSLSKLK